MSTSITTTNRLAGLHSWPTAHEARKYLRDSHRHMFVIRTTVGVSHDERDVEFHDLQVIVERVARSFGTETPQGLDYGAQSCETLARRLGTSLHGDGINVVAVSWSEDDENTATITFEEETP